MGGMGRVRALARPASGRSGHLLSHPLVQLLDGWGISGIFDVALVGQRGRNCRYSDFAVAAIEIWLVTAALGVELRCIVLGHCCTPWDLSLVACLARFARDRDGERLRPKCATNRVLSWHLYFALGGKSLFKIIGKLFVGFASRCSGFGHGRLSKAALVCGPRVAHKFRQARVACNCAYLMCGAPGLSQSPGRRLPQPMGRAVRQSRFVAFPAKPATKSGPLEWPALPGGHEG